jgi:glycosyltransferase involved in cell wall biosynthesis
MLASGAGRIVPFNDPPAIAKTVCEFAEQPELLARARAESRRIGSQLTWPCVASATERVLREAASSSWSAMSEISTATDSPPNRIGSLR